MPRARARASGAASIGVRATALGRPVCQETARHAVPCRRSGADPAFPRAFVRLPLEGRGQGSRHDDASLPGLGPQGKLIQRHGQAVRKRSWATQLNTGANACAASRKRSLEAAHAGREGPAHARCLISCVVLAWCPREARAPPVRRGYGPQTPLGAGPAGRLHARLAYERPERNSMNDNRAPRMSGGGPHRARTAVAWPRSARAALLSCAAALAACGGGGDGGPSPAGGGANAEAVLEAVAPAEAVLEAVAPALTVTAGPGGSVEGPRRRRAGHRRRGDGRRRRCPGPPRAAAGEAATLVAVPAAGYRLAGWTFSGEGAPPACSPRSPANACVLEAGSLGADAAVEAVFEAVPATLTVSAGVGGSVSATVAGAAREAGPKSSMDIPFSVEASAALVAVPGPGWRFDGWRGACAALERRVCALHAGLVGDAATAAAFAAVPATLTVSAGANGSVAVAAAGADPAEVGPDSAQGFPFSAEAEAALEAVPEPGHRFAGWALSGSPPLACADGPDVNPCALEAGSVRASAEVRAAFAVVTTLTVAAGAGGRVRVSSDWLGMVLGRVADVTVRPDSEQGLRIDRVAGLSARPRPGAWLALHRLGAVGRPGMRARAARRFLRGRGRHGRCRRARRGRFRGRRDHADGRRWPRRLGGRRGRRRRAGDGRLRLRAGFRLQHCGHRDPDGPAGRRTGASPHGRCRAGWSRTAPGPAGSTRSRRARSPPAMSTGGPRPSSAMTPPPAWRSPPGPTASCRSPRCPAPT